jgi:hypothetical protein
MNVCASERAVAARFYQLAPDLNAKRRAFWGNLLVAAVQANGKRRRASTLYTCPIAILSSLHLRGRKKRKEKSYKNDYLMIC